MECEKNVSEIVVRGASQGIGEICEGSWKDDSRNHYFLW